MPKDKPVRPRPSRGGVVGGSTAAALIPVSLLVAIAVVVMLVFVV